MNPILSGHFNHFKKEIGCESWLDSEAFEAFALSTVIRRYHCNSIELDDFLTGRRIDAQNDPGSDCGIDGIVMLVNGRTVCDLQDLESEIEFKSLDVSFVFVQAKVSPKFDSGEISKFCHGVENFFKKDSELKFNRKLSNFRSLADKIFDSAIYLTENPTIFCYYVTTGEWTDPTEPVSFFNSLKSRLEEKHLFSKISWSALGEKELIDNAKTLRNRAVAQLRLKECVLLPQIEGVSEAHVGVVVCKDYVDLISDSNGNLRREVFNDNVRDFQGDNPINVGIGETLRNEAGKRRFVLMNNGITIVAREAKRRGEFFVLTDFQVVNGCQTSNMLHQNRHILDDEIRIPIKLISTSDPDLTNDVIQATNRQTTVSVEAFESLQPFHRTLEDYYDAQRQDGAPLYYERRSKQYEFDDSVNRFKVVSLAKQTQAFVAIYLSEPYNVHKYFGQVLDYCKERIYLENHFPDPYYLSSLLVYLVERQISQQNWSSDYRRWRYHLAYLIFIKLIAPKNRAVTVKKNQSYYSEAIKKALVPDEFNNLFIAAVTTLNAKADQNQLKTDRRLHHKKVFFEKLVGNAELPKNKSQQTSLGSGSDNLVERDKKGLIKVYDRWKGYGFTDSKPEEAFFHVTEITDLPFRFRYMGMPIVYDLYKDAKGFAARNIRLDEEEYRKRFSPIKGKDIFDAIR